MKATLKAAVIALSTIVALPALAQDTISATHVFPASLIYSRSFLEYVKKANEAGKGVFTIQVRGGPEAIGMMEQPGAVRSGVVDMVYSACAFYAAVVPECDALSASSTAGATSATVCDAPNARSTIKRTSCADAPAALPLVETSANAGFMVASTDASLPARSGTRFE